MARAGFGVMAATAMIGTAMTMIAVTRASADSPLSPAPVAQNVAIPAYINPTADPADWATLADSSSPGGIVVVNDLNGPNSQPDPSWASVIHSVHASGRKVVGYVDSGYLGSPIAGYPNGLPTRSGQYGLSAWLPQIDQDVNAWFQFYGSDMDGIFFDEATNACGPTANSSQYSSTYSQLTGYVKQSHPGSTTVINPGTAVPQCYEQSADVLVTFEGSYGDYTGNPVSPAEQYVPLSWNPVDPNKIWHIIYGVPDQASMESVVALSKTRGAGWVYATPLLLPNPYQGLPPAPYWTDELTQAATSGATSQAPPSVPSGLQTNSQTSTTVSFAWSPSTASAAPLAGYDVYQNGTWVGSVPGDTTSYTANNLTPNTPYSFTVTARDTAGDVSAASAPLADTTNRSGWLPPWPPTNLAVTSSTFSTVTLSWGASFGFSPVKSYQIDEGTTPIAQVPASLTSVTIGVPQPGLSTYTFSVQALDATGNLSSPGNYVAATPPPIPDNAPVDNPTVVVNADGSISYSADFPLPYAFQRVFIATGNSSLPCWNTGNIEPICADYLIENGRVLVYNGNGTDFNWTLVDNVPPAQSGADTFTWTVPAADLDSPAGQTVVFNGEGYSPLYWSDLVNIGTAPGPVTTPYPASDQATLQQQVLAAVAAEPAPTPPPPVTVPTTGGASSCPTTPDGQWHLTRTGGCLEGTSTFHSSLLDGLLVGGFDITTTDVMTLNPASRTWNEWVTLNMGNVTGNVPPYSVTLTPTCGGSCSEGGPVTVALVPGAPVTLALSGSDPTTTTDWLALNWGMQLTPQIPAVTLPFTPPNQTSTVAWSTAGFRCGGGWPIGSPGCVFPEAVHGLG